MNILERFDRDRRNSVIAFVSNKVCIPSLEAYKQETFKSVWVSKKYHLVPRPESGGWLFQDLFEKILRKVTKEHAPEEELKHRVYPSSLLEASELVWFRASEEPPVTDELSGDFACALNIAVGEELGLATSFYNEHGNQIPSPITEAFKEHLCPHLSEWKSEKISYTNEARAEGVDFDPGFGEPALWGPGGGTSPGAFDISPGLIWRISRLEMAVDYVSDPGRRISDETIQLLENEILLCAELFSRETDIPVRTNHKL